MMLDLNRYWNVSGMLKNRLFFESLTEDAVRVFE